MRTCQQHGVEQIRAKEGTRWVWRCRSCRRESNLKYRTEHKEGCRATTRQCYDDLRDVVFERYGKICACCGEHHRAFLTIDHIAGGGTKHRREVGSGIQFYYWLKRNGFPPGFRTLCMNCNYALGVRGGCPHGNGGMNGAPIQ